MMKAWGTEGSMLFSKMIFYLYLKTTYYDFNLPLGKMCEVVGNNLNYCNCIDTESFIYLYNFIGNHSITEKELSVTYSHCDKYDTEKIACLPNKTREALLYSFDERDFLNTVGNDKYTIFNFFVFYYCYCQRYNLVNYLDTLIQIYQNNIGSIEKKDKDSVISSFEDAFFYYFNNLNDMKEMYKNYYNVFYRLHKNIKIKCDSQSRANKFLQFIEFN